MAVPATDFPGDQSDIDAQACSVAGDSGQPTAIGISPPMAGAPSADDTPRAATELARTIAQPPSGGKEQGPPATNAFPPPKQLVSLADPFLALAADVVDDLEKVRIANENRLRQLTRTETDKDGEERGFGLTEDHPDVARLSALVDMLGQAEHQAVLNLQRLMRKHPLGPWIKATAGVGEKQAARLLAVIGDPYIRPELVRDGVVEPARPRRVSELWAYCGYHVLPAGYAIDDTQSRSASGTDFSADHGEADAQKAGVGGEQAGHSDHNLSDFPRQRVGVAPKRRRGTRTNWSTTAKTRTFLIAESCIKHRQSPFRAVYDATREKYADAVHAMPCARCGPSGKPAPAASPLSDGHKHARAMRAVSKEILKALWREARRIHEGGDR
jgi:hypothetical protein